MVLELGLDRVDGLTLVRTRIIGHTGRGFGAVDERAPVEIRLAHRIQIQTHQIQTRVCEHELLQHRGVPGGRVGEHVMLVPVIGQGVHEERGHVAGRELRLRIALRLNRPVRAVLVLGHQIDACVHHAVVRRGFIP